MHGSPEFSLLEKLINKEEFMIRMFQSQTSAQAKDYFRDALSRADYYIEDQELNGVFNGRIAKRLGLENQSVDKKTFDQLCDNINPLTDQSLTPKTVHDRRVGYDISFHCPKSVSILHALADDPQILQSFEMSVHETMLEIESDVQTRIRLDGQNDDRLTGELLWTNFVHQTARPVEGHAPDPHLHCHCFTFNVTYDTQEHRFKAGQFHNIKRDMPYYQARFQKRLADKLANAGYGIRKTRDAFEVAVVPQKAIDHFSKRTDLIGRVAKEKGITNPQQLAQLGARTRQAKNKNLSMPELKEEWFQQLTDHNITGKTPEEVPTIDSSMTAKEAVDHAINHVFTRNSVKRDRQILAQSYLYAIDNHEIDLESIEQAFDKNDVVFKIKVGSQMLCTTQLVHAQERRMINSARHGLGQLRPLKIDFDLKSYHNLNAEQQLALNHVMMSQDRLTMIRGGAGTGKTTLLKSAVPTIEQTGKQCFLFAPTSEASRDVLHKEGFDKADTVARLLLDTQLQDQIKNQVIWVDEAGMLGSSDMAELLEIVEKQNARLILSGDPRQHSAVMRGDAMRLLQSVGHIPIVSMEQIYRQKVDTYKQAVYEISQGNIQTGFTMLNEKGHIKTHEASDINGRLVDDFIKARLSKKSALVVTPTRKGRAELNGAIRKNLQELGMIGKREKTVTTYHNLYLTEAQKQDIRNYKEGQIIQTHQNMSGIKKGSVLTVSKINKDNIQVTDKAGTHHILPTQKAKDYDVYQAHTITISKGDEIRISKNGYDSKGRRLNNSTILTIQGFTREGDIKAVKISKSRKSEFILKKDHGNFDYAYATTSYGAQGKTVDTVLIAQPSATFPASNQKQFYVSVSRARENVTIYTDDSEQLLGHIEKSGNRQGATELVTDNYFNTKTIDVDTFNTKEIAPKKDKGYEPEL
ncbi:MAG: MobF family relaxase [Bacteroidota bacterium]